MLWHVPFEQWKENTTSRQTSKRTFNIQSEKEKWKKKLDRNNNKSFFARIKRIIITSGSTGPFVSLGFVLCCRAHKQTHTHTRSLVHPTYLHLFVALAHTQPNPVRANYCAFVVRRNINISPLRNTRFQFT